MAQDVVSLREGIFECKFCEKPDECSLPVFLLKEVFPNEDELALDSDDNIPLKVRNHVGCAIEVNEGRNILKGKI